MTISELGANLIDNIGQKKASVADSFKITKDFGDLLSLSIEESPASYKEISQEDVGYVEQKSIGDITPNWVDADYSFDPLNTRRPNMREFLEKISGRTVEELYADPNSDWQKLAKQASDILYGVVNVNEDKRDWSMIMDSADALVTSRIETGIMHEPKVDIVSVKNIHNQILEQQAVLKDKDGEILSPILGSKDHMEQTLLNYGATSASIPDNIEAQIAIDNFDVNTLELLKNYSGNSQPAEGFIKETITSGISKRLSNDIYLDEITKL